MNAPEAPDPGAVAEEQQHMNKKTAITQQQLNMVDQFTPYGSSTYKESGQWGAEGDNKAPHYSNTVTLSPAEQAKLDQQNQFAGIVNNLGIQQGQKLTGLLDKPVQLGNEAVESRLMELGRARLDPMLADRTAGLENKLYNQGVMPGTKAYDDAMRADTEGSNDAYNQLMLTGRGMANQEMLTERNQPINEITALMSGGQVTQPSWQQTPQTQVAGTDVAGMRMNLYNQQVGQNNAMMGGLFGLGGAAIGGAARFAASDRRLKEDIKRVGTADNGLPVYTYRYKGSDMTVMGVMADEVEKVMPEAVADIGGGYKGVDYNAAFGGA